MNLMFLNSMEKCTEEGRVVTAQVSIGESRGAWMVLWSEQGPEGQPMQETWYEGTHWDEMLTVFRERVFAKQGEGYSPLLNMQMGEKESLNARSAYLQLLQFYSETHAREDVYETLRQWRFKQSGAEGKAPFIVATNRLLKMIAAFLPQTPEELLQLPGFGKAKAAAYSEAILAVTAAVERESSFPLSWVENAVDHAELGLWLRLEQERKMKAESEKQQLKGLLLEAASSGRSLDELQEQTGQPRRSLVLSLEELHREGYDLAGYAEAMLEEIPEAERQTARQAFSQHGERYLKPILQAVYPAGELSAKETDRAYEWIRLLRIVCRSEQKEQTAAAS